MQTKKHVFTSYEKKCFKNIIKQHTKIINNKDTDKTSLKSKNAAWNTITAEFNANPLVANKASQKQLRRLWMNLKQRRKQALIKSPQNRQTTSSESSNSDPGVYLYVSNDRSVEPKKVQEEARSITSEPLTQETDHIDSCSSIKEEPICQTTTSPSRSPQSCLIKEDSICANTTSPVHHQTEQTQKSLAVLEVEKNTIKHDNKKHQMELKILEQQMRECKAKADLAELILKDKQNFCNVITVQILREQLREARAKADLAEFNLIHKQNLRDTPP